MTRGNSLRPLGTVRHRREGVPHPHDDLDPSLVEDLGEELVHMAGELQRLAPGLSVEETRVLRDAIVGSFAALRAGSTASPINPELQGLIESGAAAPLVGGPGARKPLIASHGFLYHHRSYVYEGLLADRLRPRLGRTTRDWGDALPAALEATVGAGGVALSSEQLAAIEAAVDCPMTVVTGGPGTGKTSLVLALLILLFELGVDPSEVTLAAPTGKAAHRLGESISSQVELLDHRACDAIRACATKSTTLHRLLRFSPTSGRFLRGDDSPVDSKWVVVDEASMIDLVLMERLARCLPEDAHLVLLGDASQLPSVDAGAVLRDIIAALEQREIRAVVRLTKNYRVADAGGAAAQLVTLANAVHQGAVEELREVLGSGGAVTVTPVSPTESRGFASFLDRWFEDNINRDGLLSEIVRRPVSLEGGRPAAEDETRVRAWLEALGRCRVLTMTRVGRFGSDALNEAFHLRVCRELGLGIGSDFVPGEPVMALRNDYQRELFNGDSGVILPVSHGEAVTAMAFFPRADGFRAHHLPALRPILGHGFALTVHKSQGSEFERVAMVVPEREGANMSREIVYTGLTRARRSVEIVGSVDALLEAISQEVVRYSGLAERLS